MYRILVIALLISNIFTVGLLYKAAEETPKPTKMILTVAVKTYFTSCVESLTFAGFPKDDILVICKENSNRYLRELAEFINEDPESVLY